MGGGPHGADPQDSDTVATSTPHAIYVPLTVYIGGIAVTPGYQGASGYPGLNQINVTIPSSVAQGCGIPIIAVSGNIVSNLVSIPVNANGGACSDPVINGTSNFSPSASGYRSGTVTIVQATGLGMTNSSASAVFQDIVGQAGTGGNGLYTLGNCYVSQSVIGAREINGITTTGLNAGTVTVTGPSGTLPLPAIASLPGDYSAVVPAGFVPTSGGSFVFTGTGGSDVGAFTATVNYTNPIVWTNMGSISGVTRSQGVTVTWTGGDSNGYVLVTGTSSSPETASTPVLGAGFLCYAPVSAGQLTVPSYILLGMPAGQGSLAVENATTPVVFTAPGLDYATGFAAFYSSIVTPYQ